MKTSAVILSIFLLFNSAYAERDYSTSKESDNGHFKVSYTSKLNPIEINSLLAWYVLIKDSQGELVSNAEIAIAGGMPEHNHGFPTEPRITKNLGEGCYLLEGLKFHMLGWWTVTLAIKQGDITDTVTFNLKL